MKPTKLQRLKRNTSWRWFKLKNKVRVFFGFKPIVVMYQAELSFGMIPADKLVMPMIYKRTNEEKEQEWQPKLMR